ncbi:Ribonuclease P protein subunit p38 [Desmophyllum pertusum]|uniref:Ribonuclease P protein subunit p38 n=1 Tax=Desmophyllum pertusum TaxID=174260 RepID=A0A9X0A299_9CNID|nr:Ribonuclease P protein subunit p38 [Desmophyllum pertusum]
MAATVKRDGIRKRRFPQSSTKHALSTPYHLQWPTLKKGGNKIIVNEIVRTLEPLHFEQLCTRTKKLLKTLPTEYYDEATALRFQQEQEEKAKKAKLRSSLVIGLNQVTRALEKGTLKLVLVRIQSKLP